MMMSFVRTGFNVDVFRRKLLTLRFAHTYMSIQIIHECVCVDIAEDKYEFNPAVESAEWNVTRHALGNGEGS